MEFTLKNLREKWLPILKQPNPKEVYLEQFLEDLALYKLLNPNDAWRQINVTKL